MSAAPWLKPHHFQKGQSGNPNGKPRNRVKMALEAANMDVVKDLILLLPELAPPKRADVMLELLSYLQGKPKEVEEVFTTDELVAMLEARLPPQEKAS